MDDIKILKDIKEMGLKDKFTSLDDTKNLKDIKERRLKDRDLDDVQEEVGRVHKRFQEHRERI